MSRCFFGILFFLIISEAEIVTAQVPNVCLNNASAMFFADSSKCSFLYGTEGCCQSDPPAITVSSSCGYQCSNLYYSWWCSASCRNVSAFASVNDDQTTNVAVCLSSVQRLWDACTSCDIMGNSIYDWMNKMNYNYVDDSATPQSRSCVYPGCKCSSSALCQGSCSYNSSTNECYNPSVPTVVNNSFSCFDFLDNSSDYLSSTTNECGTIRSSNYYSIALRKICGEVTAQGFIDTVVSTLSLPPCSIQVIRIDCGSVVVQYDCRAKDEESANQICQQVRNELENTKSLLSYRLQALPNYESTSSSSESHKELWALFGLMVIPLICLCMCCLWYRNKRRESDYRHLQQQELLTQIDNKLPPGALAAQQYKEWMETQQNPPNPDLYISTNPPVCTPSSPERQVYLPKTEVISQEYHPPTVEDETMPEPFDEPNDEHYPVEIEQGAAPDHAQINMEDPIDI